MKTVFDVVVILFAKEIVPTAAEEIETKARLTLALALALTLTLALALAPALTKAGKRLQLKASWGSAMTMMADIGFLPSIAAFDRDTTNDETVELLTLTLTLTLSLALTLTLTLTLTLALTRSSSSTRT